MKNYVYYRNNNTNKKSSTLNTPTGHTETNPVIVNKKLIGWFLYQYKNREIQRIHQ